jgi:hypothetical protein
MRIYRIYNTIIIVATCLALFTSCKNHDATQEDLGYSYFPINDGDYSIFSVVDTIFNGINNGVVVDSSASYFLKEEIHEPITVADETRYQVYRYYSSDVNTWNDYPDSVWTEFNTNGKIVRIENNMRFVKLIFPLVVGKTWNGNIANTNPQLAQTYTMINVFRPFSYDSQSFPKTVTVVQYNDSSAIGSHYSGEVYANEIGLVYKEIKRYEHQDNSNITPLVSGGRHYIQKLLSYGKYK